jgi:predicted short-subunit dehydrogenase-like oxidoreductase (DUF2520 family)
VQLLEVETLMMTRVRIVGHGRVGGALAARLADRGLLVDDRPELIVLCVPDAAIADVASQLDCGPWVSHVSGATPLAALAPHTRRFSVHPLQTFTAARGAEQIDGAWAAVTGETEAARETGDWLARTLGLRPFLLADDRRAIYHAGAVFASNYLVTLHRAASRALAAASVPPDALEPLMRRTMENGFDLTGPIARGDRATIEAHLAALAAELPDLAALYRTLAEATRT